MHAPPARPNRARTLSSCSDPGIDRAARHARLHVPSVLAVLLLALNACGDADGGAGGPDTGTSSDAADTIQIPEDGAPAALPGCGDGVVEGVEECDDGTANDNATPDACRTNCRLPRCGDGVVDSGEACDDGNRWGGDGCSATCTTETDTLEAEPNDAPATAATVSSGTLIAGSLPAGDRDCFALDVTSPGWVRAASLPIGDAPCADIWIRLHGPDGSVRARSAARSEAESCAAIAPQTHPAANFLASGRYAVCVEGVQRVDVRAYRLVVETASDACDTDRFEVDPSMDLDGDGVPDPCDDDIDGDGVPNAQDNCPEIPNGPEPPAFAPAANGHVRWWMMAGAFAQSGGEECLPIDEQLPSIEGPSAKNDDGEPGDDPPDDGEPGDDPPDDGEPGDDPPDDGEPGDDPPDDGEPGDDPPDDGEPGDDPPDDGEPGDEPPDDEEPPAPADGLGALQPELGDAIGEARWRPVRAASDGRVDLTTVFQRGAPRSNLAFIHVRSDAEHDAELRLGTDDGVRVWWNGALVHELSTCRGVTIDSDVVPITITAGWNTLLLHVRDNGGGWGLTARIVDEEGNAIPGLTYSLTGEDPWTGNQRDSVGDGVGDACRP